MKPTAPEHSAPEDADARRAAKPVICYPIDDLPARDSDDLATLRQTASKSAEILVPPRDARCINVPKGSFFRIVSTEGPQVGDLNLWNAQDLSERFFSGKTRALHGTHVSTGDQLWSTLPNMRPMATITRCALTGSPFANSTFSTPPSRLICCTLARVVSIPC